MWRFSPTPRPRILRPLPPCPVDVSAPRSQQGCCAGSARRCGRGRSPRGGCRTAHRSAARSSSAAAATGRVQPRRKIVGRRRRRRHPPRRHRHRNAGRRPVAGRRPAGDLGRLRPDRPAGQRRRRRQGAHLATSARRPIVARSQSLGSHDRPITASIRITFRSHLLRQMTTLRHPCTRQRPG
jgi:hypothetical protein